MTGLLARGALGAPVLGRHARVARFLGGRWRATTVALALALSLVAGCGPSRTHQSDVAGPYNLVVTNYSGDDVDIVLGDSGTIGTVDAHSTGYYYVAPRTTDLTLVPQHPWYEDSSWDESSSLDCGEVTFTLTQPWSAVHVGFSP